MILNYKTNTQVKSSHNLAYAGGDKPPTSKSATEGGYIIGQRPKVAPYK